MFSPEEFSWDVPVPSDGGLVAVRGQWAFIHKRRAWLVEPDALPARECYDPALLEGLTRVAVAVPNLANYLLPPMPLGGALPLSEPFQGTATGVIVPADGYLEGRGRGSAFELHAVRGVTLDRPVEYAKKRSGRYLWRKFAKAVEAADVEYGNPLSGSWKTELDEQLDAASLTQCTIW